MTTDKTTERLRILAEAGPALFTLAERGALLERACDYAVQALGMEAMAILLVDREQGVVRIVAHRNLPDFLLEIGRALPLGKGMAGWVAATGEAQVLDDAPADPRLAYVRDDLLRMNIHGLVSVPMRWADEVIGVVQGAVSRERAFGAEDVHTLTVLAGQIALALRNVERIEELKASEEKYRVLFDAARDGFFIIDMEGHYIDVNPAACQMVGYTREELLAMNTMDLVPPEYPRRPLADRQAMWRRGGRLEIDLVAKTGGRAPVDMTFGVIQYHGREAVLGVCRDVTERRRTEERIKTYQAELEDKVRLLEAQQAAIRELSTPVIQVWEGILVLPIVGAVDSARVRQIMETLLTRIVETQSAIVILDITGVPTVDTAVANHLIKTVQAARMLGARSIVTGLSPKVAQTVVELGVELTGITTCANLRAGLETALAMLGVKVEA